MGNLPHELARSWLTRLLLACIACTTTGFAAAQSNTLTDANAAAALRARFVALSTQTGTSQFRRPLYLESVESSRDLRGDIYALVDHPFAGVSAALNNAANWCDVMILHINTKYCRASTANARTAVAVSIGRKTEQPLDDAYRIDFTYAVVTATPDFLAVQLTADKGPLATSDYRIVLEAAPADGGKTILHLAYSYAFGLSGRLAMQVYLATGGLGKVGFTIVGTRTDDQPEYIGGVRGVVERNTMRYFLAIDAYLGALAAPPPEQLEKRLQGWYSAVEGYARQLHDVERADYLDMKRREVQRQQTVQ